MSQRRYTLTSSFLLPTLGFSISNLKKRGFINCYLGDDVFYEMTGNLFNQHLFLHFNTWEVIKGNFDIGLTAHVNFEYDYDIDVNSCMYVFKIRDKYIPELKNFKLGRYSRFSDSYLKAFFSKNDQVYKICKKDPEFWEGYWGQRLGLPYDERNEMWSKPERKNEVFRYKPNIKLKFNDVIRHISELSERNSGLPERNRSSVHVLGTSG